MKRVTLEMFLVLERLKFFGMTVPFLNTTQSTISARTAGLSRFSAAPDSHLSDLSFASQLVFQPGAECRQRGL